jgi:branched-chain amino acid transport system substrate-binding protein
MGGRRGLVISDGTAFGEIVANAFSEQASTLGLSVSRIRTGNQGTEGLPQRVAAIDPDVVYVATTPDLAVPLLVSARRSPRATTLAPDSLANSAFLRHATEFTDQLYLTSPFLDPSLLPPQGQGFLDAYRKRFGERAAPAAAYGYESMALLLDAIRRAGGDGDDRGAVVDAVLSTRDRPSVLGTYSIDGNGDTTLDAVSGYRISDGLPVFPVRLQAPR